MAESRVQDFIQYDEGTEFVDDVTLTDVEMFRLEMMDNKLCWICVYHHDGTRTVFWARSPRKFLTVTCTEERE